MTSRPQQTISNSSIIPVWPEDSSISVSGLVARGWGGGGGDFPHYPSSGWCSIYGNVTHNYVVLNLLFPNLLVLDKIQSSSSGYNFFLRIFKETQLFYARKVRYFSRKTETIFNFVSLFRWTIFMKKAFSC
jgi:hypothetical protein